MINKITGVKTVDFKVTAKGHGVVNWNGAASLSNDDYTVDNHLTPKLRGYTNLSGKVKEDTGYKYKKPLISISKKTRCISVKTVFVITCSKSKATTTILLPQPTP